VAGKPPVGSYWASFNCLYAKYRYDCRRRGIFFDLTKDEFLLITSGDCVYCQKAPLQKAFYQSSEVADTYFFNGIDRKDNGGGYSWDNCVPCCARCNGIKGAHLTFEEMRAAMDAVATLKRKG
jgi:5-methylcytosine-specific restriction endonuclease McrA